MDPSEPSEIIFVHRSQIVSIGHICRFIMGTHPGLILPDSNWPTKLNRLKIDAAYVTI